MRLGNSRAASIDRVGSRLWRMLRNIILAQLLMWGIVFLVLRAITLDPASALAGIRADAVTRAALQAQFGLDVPWYRALASSYQQLATAQFGLSLRDGLPSIDRIKQPLLLSAQVSAMVALLAMMSAAASFLVICIRRRAAQRLTLLAVTLAAAPSFFLAIWLSPYFPSYSEVLRAESISWRELALPILVLWLPLIPLAALYAARAEAIIESSDWLQTYQHFGIAGWRSKIIYGRSSSLRLLALVGLNCFLLSFVGAVAVEQVTGLPGLGLAMIDAINARDTPVIQLVSALTCFASSLMMGCIHFLDRDDRTVSGPE